MRKYLALLIAAPLTLFAQSHLNVQVSNADEQPVIGLQLTAKQQPSTTATTDNAGKASIGFPQTATSLDLVMLNRADLRFVQPWSGSVPIPPTSWPVYVISRGQKKELESTPVAVAVTAQINWVRASKRIEQGSSPTSREQAVAGVAESFGFDANDLTTAIKKVLASSQDPYDLGQLALFNDDYEKAAQFFKAALERGEGPGTTPASIERGFNSAFFLGQSLFQSGKFADAAAAYESAMKYRPNDPMVLNSQGLSWSKAGEPDKAREDFQKSIEIMDKGGSNSIDKTTINNNLSQAYVQLGDVQVIKGNKDSAARFYKQGLLLQMDQSGPYSEQARRTQNKLANIGQAKNR